MNIESSFDESRVASDLYFLIAKFLSNGPLKETTEVLRQELEKCKILPKRLDWQGNVHDQTFEELETQYPSVSPNHLLNVCASLLKKFTDKPKKSLLCTSIFCPAPQKRHYNILDRVLRRETGIHKGRLLSSSIYRSLQLQRITLGHLSAVYCVLFDRSGHYIVTGADDLLVKIWSAIDGRLLGTLRGASAEISDIAMDADNSLLAAGSLDKLIRVWDLQTAAPVAILQGHNGMITSVHFCPARSGDLSCLVSTSTDGSVAFWTYSHSKGGKPYFISKPVQYVERMRPGACQMICAAWSPGGAFLAAGSADHHVRVYMMAENGPKRILETAVHCDAVDSIQWAHNGLKFVSGSKDGTAILWQLHAMQWRHTKLNMTDLLPGDKTESDDSKKIKVTMVAWDHTDSYIITAVNDNSLKVWCSLSGKLVRVLRGHTDEIYVLEAHPTHPAVLLSAGHDGQLFVWDILRAISLGSFLNTIEGQGHGAIFDAKWSPDGSKVAATDSHGHLLVLGLGEGHPLLKDLPRELFFHTDYRPLARDAQGAVSDEQTGVPPHLMPPPFLVDIEGAPHPPPLQRLVPGREHASLDQLVPDTAAAGEYQFGEDNEDRLHIDYMIQALALQYNIPNGEDATIETNRPRGEGVRNSVGEWQRGDPLTRSRRAMVAPLSAAECQAKRLYIEEMTQMEMAWYRREMRRRPMMISTSTGAGGTDSRGTGGRGRRRGGAPGPRKPPPAPRTYNSDPSDDATSQDSDSSDSSVRLSVSPGYKASNTSSNSSSSSEHFSNNDGSRSSSEYSDWVADHPGVPLQPPKRSKRKPVARQRYSPHPPSNRKIGNNVAGTSTRSDVKKEQQSNNISAPPSNADGHAPHIPELYRPSDWLCAVQPRKAPYHPQMGDTCMYFKQGHSRYVDAVSEKDVYKITPRDKPWERLDIRESEAVKVVGIKYMIRPPRLVCLKLMLDSGRHFTVRYHDMPDVLDFLVLKQTYETAVERNWTPGDRFRCMIDDGWWMGTVVEGEGIGAGHFLSLRVRWDNGEFERMSPWDLEPIDDTRLPLEVGSCVSVLPSELEAMLYRPSDEEWPGGDRSAACEMIVKGIDQVLMLAIAEPFAAPVDLNIYPTYAYLIEYPIDLSTIKSRFENHFYRRVTSAQFDVRYLATNAEKFNKPHSNIVKRSRIITDLCLQIISNPFDIDVQACYHSLVDAYVSTDSDEPLSKNKANGKTSNWVDKCNHVLDGLFADSDSTPFREPVQLEELPEYADVISRPMDLGTVRQRLTAGKYSNPTQFASDVRLVFSNSKTYNTNKKSKIYSMTLRLESLFETLFKSVHRNWKAARRRTSVKVTSNSWNDSQSEDEGTTALQNGHSSAGNGFNGPISDGDSWDSDAPLGNVHQYKGKASIKNHTKIALAPTRSSRRVNSEYYNEDSSNINEDPLHLDNDDNDDDLGEEEDEEDSGDSYKPTRRDNGKDAFHRKSKKKGRKRKNPTKNWKAGKRKYNLKNKKAKKRKFSVDAASESDSTSDSDLSVASMKSAGRRYESDHSFQLRQPSGTDSDTPLGNIRRIGSGGVSNSNDAPSTSTSSRLRSNHRSTIAGDTGAGPSSARARRAARDTKKPRYNEDSDEDSIAAISKRLKAHQRPRANPITVQSRLQSLGVRSVQEGSSTNVRSSVSRVVSQPSHSRHRPSTSTSNNTEDPADDEPLSVSSRGRIRKLTPKARGFFRD